MPMLKNKGIFIESFRTTGERKRAEKDKLTEEVLRENEELKVRMSKLEEALGIGQDEIKEEE